MSTYVMPEIFHDEPEQILQFMNRELPDRFQVTKVIPQTDMKRAVGLIGEVHRHLACAGFSTRTVTVKKGYRLKLPYGSKGPSHRIFLWQTLNTQDIPQKESA